MNDGPPRVLFIVSSLHFGGAEKHTVQLLNGLDTSAFSLFARWLKPDEALLPQLQVARLTDAACLNVGGRMDRRAIRELTALLDQHDIDVVVCTNEYPAFYAWLAARRAHRRPQLVEVFHTTEYARWKERAQMLLYRALFRSFDLLVYVSENQRQYWRGHGLRARQDLCIHNGIDCETFTDHFSAPQKEQLRAGYGFQPQDYVVALCAALRPEKAHGDFVRAIARLRQKLPQIRGLIIGDGPERARIEALILQSGMSEVVHITGFQRDVRPLLACSDVAVLTSHKIETFSIAALEAMSLGKPMVLTRIGGAAEQIQPGENGFLYEPGDIDALAAHLERLADPALRLAMGRCAASRVRERFSQAHMLNQYSELLSRLVGDRRGTPPVD
jgi:glycosyltransferase involved in cell wall biosynthesis